LCLMKVVVHPQQQPIGPDGASQFVPPVHAVKVSTNGPVYVADRGGRRVQIFTIAEKFVNQVFIGRECHAPDCGNGQTAADIGFSPDPEQRYLYMANRSQAQIMIFNRKMLEFLDSLDRGAQQRDNSATLHHLSDRFERQAAAATACSNVMIEQCNPSLASLGE